ncbi:MAG: ABC transporter ATP-binding protein [Deltaproteobacteria bacterium]|nr:ABC transporter ATP-binding protein [Deltaproteobacteria bacterium]
MNTATTMLDVQGLAMDFGGLRALDGVSLRVDRGEIVALIGPNGAGKTTFFNCITGIYVPTDGDIFIRSRKGDRKRINGMKPNLVTAQGMARTFQNIRLFPNMTVLENVMIGRHSRTRSGILGAVLRGPTTMREEQATVDASYHLLEKVGLERFVNETACNLPYGAQRRLEIARAMATDPFLLLLDEPAAGMNPQETASLNVLIRKIRDEEDISILLIEHDMKVVMSLSDRVYVMEYGQGIAVGTPQEIAKDPRVIKAYLGEDADA